MRQETARAVLGTVFMAVAIGAVYFMAEAHMVPQPEPTPATAPTSIYGVTYSEEGVPFDRWCGFVMEVGRGEIRFPGDSTHLAVVYLMTPDPEHPGQKISKVLYGDHGRLDAIEPGHNYYIGRVMLSEGMNFPRRLDRVEKCPTE